MKFVAALREKMPADFDAAIANLRANYLTQDIEFIQADDWSDFCAEVTALPAEMPEYFEAGDRINDAGRIYTVYGAGEVWMQWASQRACAKRKFAHEKFLAETVRVLLRKGKKLAEERQTPEQLAAWLPAGCVLVEHETEIQDRRSEEEISMGWGKLHYRLIPHGAVTRYGIVKAARILNGKTQYAVAPLSAAAKRRYEATMAEIGNLESEAGRHGLDESYTAAREVRARIQQTRSAAKLAPCLLDASLRLA